MREVTDLYPPGIYRMSNGELRLAGYYDGFSRIYSGDGCMDSKGTYFGSNRLISTEDLEDDNATLVISVEDIMKTIKESENA